MGTENDQYHFINEAICAAKKRFQKKAIELVDKAEKMHLEDCEYHDLSDCRDFYLYTAQAIEGCGRYEKALEFYQKVDNRDEMFKGITSYEKTKIYLKQGVFKKAFTTLKEAIEFYKNKEPDYLGDYDLEGYQQCIELYENIKKQLKEKTS